MSFEDVMRLGQQRGFFFKAAETYPNSPAGFWDYGPLGVSMRNKLVELWRRMLVKRDGMVELDGAQILPRQVFEASGHLSGFTDPFVKCANCGSVFRPDKLVEEKTGEQIPEKLTDGEYDRLMAEKGVKCPKCGSKLSGTKRFNMMFRVGIGEQDEEGFLRPETCQSIFVDSPLMFKTQRIKLPVAFAQVGKSFRNEIAPRQGLLRLRELNQAEVEVFFNPGKLEDHRFQTQLGTRLNFSFPDGSEKTVTAGEAVESGALPNVLTGHYLSLLVQFYEAAGLEPSNLRLRALSEKDRAFYAVAAYDLEAKTSLGWTELVACNYRGDYDMSRHQQVSGSDFRVDDGGEKVLPHIFEMSMGVDRTVYAIIESSTVAESDRRVLRVRPYLAPQQVGVFPLVNKEGQPEKALSIQRSLLSSFDSFYDGGGSIGRRYARADEVGVPCCLTVDYDTAKDDTVTLRERDSKAQTRVKVGDLEAKLRGLLSFPTIPST
ncbi:MAG TPA: glycine--tRNA ligase [Nitrososphaerales archaeon]|nr:glycine--tRNA ligase [Nitrososphaerales archaeon]